jgi:hypothetical protein
MARGRKHFVSFDTNGASLAKDLQGAREAIRAANGQFARQMSKQVKRHYESTVAGWNRKPRFYDTTTVDGNTSGFTVGTNDLIYAGVDTGTGKWGTRKRSYIIRAKNGKFLRFRQSYTPASKPNSGTGNIGSIVGGKASRSGKWVYAKKVRHPGIKPRYFSRRIQRWVNTYGEEFYRRLVFGAIKRKGFS